jgi:hypothetical protein
VSVSGEWTGWLEAHELPASEHARTISQILQAPESAEERRELRREQAAEQAKRDGVRDIADGADARAFMRAVNGTAPRDVLGEAMHEPFRDREAAVRRRQAIDVLRPLGLSDVITGGTSGCVMDRHLGILEPAGEGVAARAELDRRYFARREERELEERRRAVDGYRELLDGRLRARGWSR